ncbi:MAG: bacterio-opsin activator domain-containing protein [Halobacteriales archaeon]
MGVDSSAVPRVLYVDPADDARRQAASAFADVGLSAATAGSIAGAEERLLQADLGCVVSERDLPDGDALSLFDAVREEFPALPFVVFTGVGDEAYASDAVGAGVSDYLPKSDDSSFAALADRVRDLVVDGRRDARKVRRHRADPDVVAAGDASTDGASSPEAVEPDASPEDRGPTGPPAEVPEDIPEKLKERAMDEAPVGITIADMNEEDGPLIYINEAFERLTGFDAEAVAGHNCRFLQGPRTDDEPVATMRAAIENEEPASVELLNYRKDGTRFWNRVDVAPIFEDGELTHYVGFQTDVSRRKRAEAAATRRAEQLARERADLAELLDRVEGLIGDVTERVVAAESREAVERELIEGVGDADPYAFAWVGRHDLATDQVVSGPAAGDPPIEDFDPGDLTFDADDPVRRAVETGELQAVDDAADRLGGCLHQGCPGRYRSMAAVPLAYRESLYGVLAVYATEPDTFDDRERAVLLALARAAATAINAIQSHRGLATDAVTELEFDLAGSEELFVALAEALDCAVTFEGAVEEDGLRLLFDVDGAGADAVEPWLADRLTDAAVLADHDDGCLVELDGAGSVFEALAERGLDLRAAGADPDEARLVVHVPGGSDDRAAAEFVRERLPGASLHAYRSRERPARTQREFRAEVESQLTHRQRGALRRAYAGGYFEWPRSVDGDELADSMDITRATFHQHLRASQRKLVTAFYEGI